LLASGNTCPIVGKGRKARTDITIKSFDIIGYSAVNAGSNEICCPQSLLNRERPSFPVISSNLLKKDTKEPAVEPFVIKSVGAIRVGILGILPTDALSDWPDSSYLNQYDIISPELAVNQYLPELKHNTDLLILLSQVFTGCHPASCSKNKRN